jgi:AbrB family transcriptional regulator, transcriptional pleiotropic regulator of transition state genes
MFHLKFLKTIIKEKGELAMNFKHVGIKRKTDDVGRIVIPKSLREVHNMLPKDPVEIFAIEEGFLVKPYKPSCVGCSGKENLMPVGDSYICKECHEQAKEE